MNKIQIYIILKLKKNLIMNLILKMAYFQEKVDLVKLKNVLVNLNNLTFNYQIIIKKMKLLNN